MSAHRPSSDTDETANSAVLADVRDHTMPGADDDRVSFLNRRLPPSLQLRVVELRPGHPRVYDPAEWRSAMVVVEHGAVELECLDGSRRHFDCGATLWLFDLPLRALHAIGDETAVLSAISRHRGTPTPQQDR